MSTTTAGAGLRPEIQRLRSNSVPVAVSLMGCTAEEARVLFSTAERASARRRKHSSVDDSSLSPQSSSEHVQTLSNTVYEDPRENDGSRAGTPSTLRESDTPRPGSEEYSPQMSPGVKAYNQDMARFIQGRLHSLAPSYCEPPVTPKASTVRSDEPLEYDFSPPPTQRPQLQSHFSNWSTTSAGSAGPEAAADLASSPPLTDDDDSIQDENTKEIEHGYAHVVQFRQRADMDKPSPNYFSWQKRKAKPALTSLSLETPLSAELRSRQSCYQEGSSPLIDLDASQPDVSRASRGDFFFNLPKSKGQHMTPSPGSRRVSGPTMHMGHHLGVQSPRPICAQ